MALERLVARRTFPLHRRTSVCRNLFGPVDHDELSRDMKAKLQEISEHSQQRWNFDFDSHTPLDGDYQWEEVEVERTPAFYRESAPADRSRSTPLRQPSSPDSVLAESPETVDVLERLALPDSSPGSSPASPVEVNQENRADKLNSGKASRTRSSCVRRKRTETTDNSNAHITGKFFKEGNAFAFIIDLPATLLIRRLVFNLPRELALSHFSIYISFPAVFFRLFRQTKEDRGEKKQRSERLPSLRVSNHGGTHSAEEDSLKVRLVILSTTRLFLDVCIFLNIKATPARHGQF